MAIRAKGTGTTIEDGERVIITEWRLAPGAETGWHRHALDYVVVYVTPAHLLVETKDGPRTVQTVAAQAYFRKAGAEHNIVNSGDIEVVFLETELK